MKTKPHYHAMISVSEESYNKLKEFSRLVHEAEFKSLTIKIEPDELVPDDLQLEVELFFISCISMLCKLTKAQ